MSVTSPVCVSYSCVLVVIVLICASCVATTSALDDNLIVQTNAGKILGGRRSAGGAEFLGIPYARPPVGDLRWREPVPMKPWSEVRAATKFGAPCSQPVLGEWNRRDSETSNEVVFSERHYSYVARSSSLTRDVFDSRRCKPGGTASNKLYKDGTLVNHGVILVTINYRLNIFGFLSHAELTRESPHHASGNYALIDLIAGLHWVRDNISKFGGDPNNVTVFGQSGRTEREFVDDVSIGQGTLPPCNRPEWFRNQSAMCTTNR